MKTEKYFVDIGEEGSEGLDLLDYCFNKTTQAFLMHAGLNSGMTVLDIGCGSGVMTCWLAQQVGQKGRVIGIENNENQLKAAKNRAQALSLDHAEFHLCSAYEIDSLHQKFDLIYCRFVLHHLHHPSEVVSKIYQALNPKGIFVSEEGIVSAAFSYPFSPAWGEDRTRLPPPWTDVEGEDRDGNIGIKMFNKMYTAGFEIMGTKIIQPLLTTREEKQLLLLGREELKKSYLAQGHSEADWYALGKELEKLIENEAQIVGFYGSCQVAGIKK